jgi:Ca2+-binding RTX toxin-like protein
MHLRLLVVAGLLVTVLASAQASRAGEQPVPYCYDAKHGESFPATKWLTSPGRLTGTAGDDVLVGTTGRDTIYGKGGNDLICSAPDGGEFGSGDNIDGGTGNDRIFGVGRLNGGHDNDYIEAYFVGSRGDGGSGNDVVYASEGASAYGGAGNDEVIVNGPGRADGGAGNDIGRGYDAESLLGGSGNDGLTNELGDPRINCGSGRDTVVAYDATSVRNCEIVSEGSEYPG